jgi:hypothetical protein
MELAIEKKETGKEPSRKYKYIIGMASVKRQTDYLSKTVEQLLNQLDSEFVDNTLVVVFNAELDPSAHTVAIDLSKRYSSIAVIDRTTLKEVYSKLYSNFLDPQYELRNKYQDDKERIYWRSKQALDAAYLMSYAESRSEYYLHLEDDLQPAKNYMRDIDNFLQSKGYDENLERWFILNFFSSSYSLNTHNMLYPPSMFQSTFGLLFATRNKYFKNLIDYIADRFDLDPVDWLIRDFLLENDQHMFLHVPSLFQHKGISSSLKGKKQGLVAINFKG